MSRRVAFYVLTAAGSMLWTGPSTARPLAPEICANIKVEISELEGKGIRAVLAKGPATARALSAEQLAAIRRLLDLDAQSIFRCPLDRPYASLREEAAEEKDITEPEPGSGGVAVPTAAAAAAAAKAAQPKAAQPKPVPSKKASAQPPAVPAAAVPAVPAPAATAPAQPAAIPAAVAAPPAKSRPKAKTPDAYKPPASGDPNATPLQDQLPKAQQ